ncbi:MAG: hypothetical protein AAF903_14780 [Pseudomonadota bacterium]
MAALTVTIADSRLKDLKEAAAYCGMAIPEFKANCPFASVETPNGRTRWDRRDLDAWIDDMKQGKSGVKGIIAGM